MAVISAGLVLYRRAPDEGALPDESRWADEGGAPAADRQADVEVLCCHMGGPLWARKDEHAWSFPKGEVDVGEDFFVAARREFAEEIGVTAPNGEYRRLGQYRYASGKVVVLFAVPADLVVDEIHGGTFEMEWPPRSGRRQAFPEIDRAAWFDLPTARSKLVVGQAPALDDLEQLLAP